MRKFALTTRRAAAAALVIAASGRRETPDPTRRGWSARQRRRPGDPAKIQQFTCHGGDMQIWRPVNV